jgi:PhzF family phenazine biosynthesis protein
MKIKLYQIDAFADKIFSGNPAAVCVLEEWLSDEMMQNIAAENNLSETAFTVKNDDNYDIRWFTPVAEVALCGHATLATAFVLFNFIEKNLSEINFQSKHSGALRVIKNGDLLILNFPADIPKEVEHIPELTKALGLSPQIVLKGKTDYLLVYSNQEEIEKIEPDFNQLLKLDVRGIIISAPGDKVDFVSRFFGPAVGVNEDPVTGSAHTTLIPYWATRLDKVHLKAKQLSKRGGDLSCEFLGERVNISGKAVLYMTAEIEI